VYPAALARAVLALLSIPLLLGSQCVDEAYDHDILQALVDASGPGALVEFPPGVHDICKPLIPLPGQTWELSGATLRRCKAVVSQLNIEE
jgi:hypothetical protein